MIFHDTLMDELKEQSELPSKTCGIFLLNLLKTTNNLIIGHLGNYWYSSGEKYFQLLVTHIL